MGILTRSVSTDTPGDMTAGRFAVVGSDTYTDIAIGIDFKRSAFDDTLEVAQGVAAYVDADNYLLAVAWRNQDSDDKLLVLTKIGGDRGDLAEVDVTIEDETFYSLRLQADSSGRWYTWLHKRDIRPGDPAAGGQLDDLATGGDLAVRKRAFYDYCGEPGD